MRVQPLQPLIITPFVIFSLMGLLNGAIREIPPLCSVPFTGSIVLSEKQFTSGQFEFNILPSMAPGVRTVFGIADDGTTPSSEFIQLMFDSETYTNSKVALEFGGFNGNDTKVILIDINTILGLKLANIQ